MVFFFVWDVLFCFVLNVAFGFNRKFADGDLATVLGVRNHSAYLLLPLFMIHRENEHPQRKKQKGPIKNSSYGLLVWVLSYFS